MKYKHIIPFAGMLAFLLLFTGARQAEAYTHTVTLRLGSSNVQVMELQHALNSLGYQLATVGAGSPGHETTYFGALTRAAVLRFQTAQALGADGIVGPITGGRLTALSNAGGTPTPTPVSCPIGYTCTPIGSNTGGALSGSAGTIATFTKLSSLNNEQVGAGQKDVQVAGFSIKASRDGDIALRNVRLTFNPNGSTGSTRLDRYISSVSLWEEGTRVATVNASDFNKESNNLYDDTIAINANDAIVRANQTARFYITVTPVSNFDSADISGDAWSVAVNSVRYQDGSGVVTTDSTTGDIGSMNVPINFVSFSTASDTNLRISVGTNTPSAGIVNVSDTRSTNNVTLLTGQFRVDGTSNVTLNNLPVTLTVSGTAANVSNVVSSLTLKLGNQTFDQSVNTTGTTGTVTFDNLNYKLTAGSTVPFTISANINQIKPGTFNEGDTIRAEITSTNRGQIDAENAQGDTLTSSERSGTAIGNELALRTNGLNLTYLNSTTSALSTSGSDNDSGQFNIQFKVAAVNNDVYISTSANGILYAVDRTGTAASGGTSAALQTNSSNVTITPNGNYRIPEGTEATFTLSVFVSLPSAGPSGAYRASLTGIKWDTTDTTSLANTYTFNLDQFRSNYLLLD